ncbi:MFS transporter [Isoptericola halotolerans]|uniref:MFS family permease n=1 Tax=Isoptericola halotolerans TaxID=300560 RepID=A0ABX2A2H4_9MICO|nr:MFS family permease [Isoptericola halotolerans]
MTAPSAPASVRRTLGWIFAGQLSVYVALAAVVAVLLPLQLADLAPDGKERALAVVSFASSALTALTLPVVGALSDRTRSRWGRRAPWAAAGGTLGGIAVALMPSATTVLALGLLWVVGQVTLNMVDAAMAAAVADDVPRHRRGTGSAALALGTGLGSAVGAVLAGRLVGDPTAAAVVAGAVAAGGAWAFLAAARRARPATWTQPPDRLPDAPRWSALRRALARPTLRSALLSRCLLVGGTQMVVAYQLYVLVDRTGLTMPEAARLSGLLVVIHLVAATTGAVVAGRWSDAVGSRRPFLVAGCLLLCVAALLPALSTDTGAVVAYAALAGIATGTFFTVQLADLVDRMPSLRDAGHDLGLLGAATTLPQAFAPLLGYAVFRLTGGYGGLFATVAVLAAAAAVVTLRPRAGTRDVVERP